MCPDIEDNKTPLLSSLKSLTEAEARMYSPLTLAFLGDAVYSLLIREMLTKCENKPTGRLHRESIAYVNAAFQAKMMKTLLPMLDENETGVFKRGRNAHSAHSPKNQSESDYRYATGFEALFGYLYLYGNFERITQIFNIISAEITNLQAENDK